MDIRPPVIDAVPRLFENRTTAFYLSAGIMLMLTLIIFSHVLFTGADIILSQSNQDLVGEYIQRRFFGFEQMRQGNIPLWNPHIMSGTPFMAEPQSALFYPPNLVFAVLPLAAAINISIALHVFLAGIFMYCWAASRKLHPSACLFAGVLFMFCGPHFLHIYPGHLSNLCTMIWAPLIFFSIDRYIADRSYRFCLLGMAAVCMQIFAGHPQYLFYTGIAAVIYAALSLFKNRDWKRLVLPLSSIYIGAMLLGAIQLLPSMLMAGESVRGGGIDLNSAADHSFPPFNVLTLIAHDFFGDLVNTPYWSRDNYWEMSMYIGVIGFFFVLYALFTEKRRLDRILLWTAISVLVLSFGKFSPIFTFLHGFVPGFNRFRGNSKFILPAATMLIMLAAIGFDRLRSTATVSSRLFRNTLKAGCIMLVVALLISVSRVTPGLQSIWGGFMLMIRFTGNFMGGMPTADTSRIVSMALIFSAVKILALAGIFYLIKKNNRYAGRLIAGILLFGILEMYLFARSYTATTDLVLRDPKLNGYLTPENKPYRFFFEHNPNLAMLMGFNDIGGTDPLGLRRYQEFLSAFQHSNRPLIAPMLRLKYRFNLSSDIGVYSGQMPQFSFIRNFTVCIGREAIFKEMRSDNFDPAKTVILEQKPSPMPTYSSDPGTITVLESTTDHFTIEARLKAPALLLMTETYADGWHAHALPGSVQKEYQVLPADYVLRAIPLTAGFHRLVIEYTPAAYTIGAWISIISWILFDLIGIILWWSYQKQPTDANGKTASAAANPV